MSRSCGVIGRAYWVGVVVLIAVCVGCGQESNGRQYVSDEAFLRGLTASDLTEEYRRTYEILRRDPQITVTLAEELPRERLRELFFALYDLSIEQRPYVMEAARVASARYDPEDATDYVAVLGSYPLESTQGALLKVADDPAMSFASRVNAIHWLNDGGYVDLSDRTRSQLEEDMDPCLRLYLLTLDTMRGDDVGRVKEKMEQNVGASAGCMKDVDRMLDEIRARR